MISTLFGYLFILSYQIANPLSGGRLYPRAYSGTFTGSAIRQQELLPLSPPSGRVAISRPYDLDFHQFFYNEQKPTLAFTISMSPVFSASRNETAFF
jgi:hypothetical protein